jgi:hypothetical protein
LDRHLLHTHTHRVPVRVTSRAGKMCICRICAGTYMQAICIYRAGNMAAARQNRKALSTGLSG